MSSSSLDGGARPLDTLVEAWDELSDLPLVVVTGAGISLASGLQTFRGTDPDAVWKVSDMEMATVDYFRRDPVAQWRWYLDRFGRMAQAEPNDGHRALAVLETLHEERGGSFTLITQNIDTLHEQAGSRRLIKIHGSSDRVRCSRFGCEKGAPRGSIARSAVDLESFAEEPSLATLPHCSDCGAPLRAHVLFFDEYYQEHADYRFGEAVEAAESAAAVVFAGTSFSVGITDLVGRAANAAGTPVFSIDPNPAPESFRYDAIVLPEPAERLLPRLVEALGGAPASQPTETS